MELMYNESVKFEFIQEIEQFTTEVNRIERLLENTLKKLEFAMEIPDLLENEFTTINELLSPTSMFHIKKGLQKYTGHSEGAWCFQKADDRMEIRMSRTLNEAESFFNTYNPHDNIIPKKSEFDIIKSLHILYENKNINKLCSKYVDNISEGAFNFIQDMKFLFYISIEKMKLTPSEVLLKDEFLAQMYAHHDELLDYASVLQNKTSRKVKEDIAFVKSKEGEMHIWRDELTKIRKECEKIINKAGRHADNTMILDWNRSELKMESLLSDIQSNSVNMGMLRKTFGEDEKELRVKKYHTEQQLMAVIEQYDRDMQERQEVYEYKKEIFKRENEQLNLLQARYDDQTSEFNMMVKEKKDYEQRLVEGRLYELKCKINARRIQRFYRNYKKLLSIQAKKIDVQKGQGVKAKQKKNK